VPGHVAHLARATPADQEAALEQRQRVASRLAPGVGLGRRRAGRADRGAVPVRLGQVADQLGLDRLDAADQPWVDALRRALEA